MYNDTKRKRYNINSDKKTMRNTYGDNNDDSYHSDSNESGDNRNDSNNIDNYNQRNVILIKTKNVQNKTTNKDVNLVQDDVIMNKVMISVMMVQVVTKEKKMTKLIQHGKNNMVYHF